jgi:hypothetical protein
MVVSRLKRNPEIIVVVEIGHNLKHSDWHHLTAKYYPSEGSFMCSASGDILKAILKPPLA